MGCIGRLRIVLVVSTTAISFLYPRVGKGIQAEYIQRFENKAVFLKVPVRGARQVLHVLDSGLKLDRGNLNQAVRFKVGDRVRVTDVDFKDNSVRFRFSSIEMVLEGVIVFQFPSSTQFAFPQRENFEKALDESMTEGLSYKELESAKGEFIQRQFKVLVRDFASTTSTSDEVVIRTIVEESLQFQALSEKFSQASQENGNLSQELARIRQNSQEQKDRIGKMTAELDRVRNEFLDLKNERDEKTRDSQSMRSELKNAQAKMNDLLKSLNLKAVSNSELDNRIQSLGGNIESLRRERDGLSEELTQTRAGLSELELAHSKLTKESVQVQRKNRKLTSELRSLTSNKDSLQARFIEAKRDKETLQMVSRLNSALRIDKYSETREGRPFEVVDLFLLSKRIGRFEIQVPTHPGQICRMSFLMESPDRVAFQEDERVLYNFLGKTLKIRPSWSFAGDHLRAVLMEGEETREAKSREKVQWAWVMEGRISEPERIGLRIELINSDGQEISLAPHEYFLIPTGLLTNILHNFSLISMGLGILLGLAFSGLVGFIRGRSPRKTKPELPTQKKSNKEYVVQKRL